MTPIPDEAVELAARVVANFGHEDESPSMWDESPEDVRQGLKEIARAQIEAALPALREAVVGEFKPLVGKWRDEAERWPGGRHPVIWRMADELAALTEQENRNG